MDLIKLAKIFIRKLDEKKKNNNNFVSVFFKAEMASQRWFR